MAQPLQPLSNLNPNRYAFPTGGPTHYAFPSTADSWVADGVAPHTMMIFSHETTTMAQKGVSAFESAQNYFKQFGESFTGNASDIENILNLSSQKNLLQNRTQRLSQTNLKNVFTMYMPTPIVYPLKNEYEEMKLMETIGSNLGAFVSTAMNVGILKNLGSAAGEAAAYAGYPINPKVEVIFRNIMQRVFEFNFLFYPSSQQETSQLKFMLQMLRHDASPTRMFTGGLVWKAPNTFDIMLLHKGKENTEVPRISECVCEEIEINYTPTNTGWVTFSNGHPVATQLRIVFREREPIDRENVLNGF
jgi:hypothetical protein